MSGFKTDCQQLWSKIVMLRDRHCRLCDDLSSQAHHIFYRSAGDWKIVMDADYGVGLCTECHGEAHDNKERFLDRLVNRLSPQVREKILKQVNTRKKPQTEKATWRDIRARLKVEYKELEETIWMDDF